MQFKQQDEDQEMEELLSKMHGLNNSRASIRPPSTGSSTVTGFSC